MKKSFFIIWLIVNILSSGLFSQQNKKSGFISKKDLLGTWQRNDSLVGSGLSQNFEFFANDSFVLNLGSNSDDVRDIVQLKGKYRIDGNRLFFTIISRSIAEGPVDISDPGISQNIFSISNGVTKEIEELNPKELSNPCYIVLFSKTHIKINNEVYFKVRSL